MGSRRSSDQIASCLTTLYVVYAPTVYKQVWEWLQDLEQHRPEIDEKLHIAQAKLDALSDKVQGRPGRRAAEVSQHVYFINALLVSKNELTKLCNEIAGLLAELDDMREDARFVR